MFGHEPQMRPSSPNSCNANSCPPYVLIHRQPVPDRLISRTIYTREALSPLNGSVDLQGFDGSTRVGAILLFLVSFDASDSISLASLLTPVTCPVALCGVSGGVVRGTPVTFPELVAVMAGTLPLIR